MSSQFNYFKQNKVDVTGVLHVGAHRGEEIYDYETMGVKQVIWVEPVPELFDEMETFLTTAQCAVTSHAYEYAASNTDHEMVEFNLYYGPDAAYMRGNKGCSSLLKTSGRFESWSKGTVQVETIKIDTLLDENDFNSSDFQYLNMDVQGAELMVLQGAIKFLDTVKYIATEATWDNPDYIDNTDYNELKSLLESKGFIETEIYRHAENWGDALFVKGE
jgi:FkbM family methyltransferase